jgi:hypothetical protein
MLVYFRHTVAFRTESQIAIAKMHIPYLRCSPFHSALRVEAFKEYIWHNQIASFPLQSHIADSYFLFIDIRYEY